MTRLTHALLGFALVAMTPLDATAADPPHPDRLSPVHFRPARGNFSDPVPFYWKGTYHVFYLRGHDGKVPWEHIASEDLVRWRELPTALKADGPEDGPDGDAMFTGAVVEHEGVFHAFYTGHNPRNPKGIQFVLHATSPDLVTWTKHRGHAFGPDGKVYANKRDSAFRDPFIYRDGAEGRWQMLLCARTAGDDRPVTGRYSSADLLTWRPETPLCGGYAVTPDCPDLFALGAKHYLLVSPSEHGDGATTYRSADRLAGPWSPAPGVPLDTPIWNAAKSQFDGTRHVVTGWLRDRDGGRDAGGYVWGGTQSVPRELFAGAGGELLSRPVPEVRRPYSKTAIDLATRPAVKNVTPDGKPADAGPWRYEGDRLVGEGVGPNRVRLDAPADYHLTLAVKLTGPAATFAVALRQQPGDDLGSHYRLEVRPSKGVATLAGPKYDFPRAVAFAEGADIEIEAFVQGGLIECFVNGGYAFSDRVYANLDGSLDLVVTGGRAEVRKLVVRTALRGQRSEPQAPAARLACQTRAAGGKTVLPVPRAGEPSWPSCKSTRPSAARRSRSPRPPARRSRCTSAARPSTSPRTSATWSAPSSSTPSSAT